jgi:hypothetical protein
VNEHAGPVRMELAMKGAQVVARDPFAGNGWFLR